MWNVQNVRCPKCEMSVCEMSKVEMSWCEMSGSHGLDQILKIFDFTIFYIFEIFRFFRFSIFRFPIFRFFYHCNRFELTPRWWPQNFIQIRRGNPKLWGTHDGQTNVYFNRIWSTFGLLYLVYFDHFFRFCQILADCNIFLWNCGLNLFGQFYQILVYISKSRQVFILT